MNGLVYDVLVKGVLPLAIVAVLGYYAKKYIAAEKAIKKQIFAYLVIGTIFLGIVYIQYNEIFIPYELESLPETTNIPGSILGSDDKRSYWEIREGKPFSVPLFVKLNRVLSLHMELDTAPVEIKYITGNGVFNVIINDKSASILDGVLTNDILSMGAAISGSISKDNENILALKMFSSKDIKIYSFKVKRDFTPLRNWVTFIVFSIFWLIIISLVYFKIVSGPGHNKSFKQTSKSSAA
jgi:hypothetical protein